MNVVLGQEERGCVLGHAAWRRQFVASPGSRFLILDVIGQVYAHRGWSQNCPSTLKGNVHKVSAFEHLPDKHRW